jgi:hypothetical protein
MTKAHSQKRRWNISSVGDRVLFPLKEKEKRQKEKKTQTSSN